MSKMQAAVVQHDQPGNVGIASVEAPVPAPNEALVKVKAVSLNLGEVRYAQSRSNGKPIGWDLAGVVEKAAQNGSGPEEGTPVVGFVSTGAWAQLAVVNTDSLAELPEDVSFEVACTLPVAGLTALHVLEKGTGLLDRNVLITGANGGVGLFACQLAKLMGAVVTAQVRRDQYVDLVKEMGADKVVLTEDGVPIAEQGPSFRLVAESIGGKMLAHCLKALAPDGICVSFGNSSNTDTVFNAASFYSSTRARLYAFLLFHELHRETAAEGLSRLLDLVSKGKLKPLISAQDSFENIGKAAKDLWDRKIPGKAVVTIN